MKTSAIQKLLLEKAKTSHIVEDNIWYLYIWQRIYIEDFKFNKTNDPILKWAKDLYRHFVEDAINGQITHNMMFNIINHQRNKNKNHKILLLPTRNAKIKFKITNVGRI